ncbi:MAG: cation:proton antiporter [Vulcanimicrobiota bacterium]
MTETGTGHATMVVILGLIITLTICIRAIAQKLRIPSLVGFILLGLLLKILDNQFQFLSEASNEILLFLADVGIITFLFKVGLESDIGGLLKQFKKASLVWAGGVITAGATGFLVTHYLLDIKLITSTIIATALTASSVGVSVSVWKEKGQLKSSTGELLLDSAELDDISGVIFMALLFAIIPLFRNNQNANLASTLGKTAGIIFLKLLLFGTLCALFSLYFERQTTEFFRKIEPPAELMLLVLGVGFIFSAIAGFLGFSVAIGAFFAGLAFSRDPKSVKIDANFESIYDLFSPFFFIGIGLKTDPGVLTQAIVLGGILVLVAFITKALGHGLPVLLTGTRVQATLVGISLVPRAEITMIIMEQGKNMGNWAVPPEAYAAMVTVTIFTCILAPLLVRKMLDKWPQGEEG